MLASFWDFTSNPATLAIFMAMLIPLAGIITAVWRGIERTKSVNALKQSMIERGMSVDEIERVLAAGGKQNDD